MSSYLFTFLTYLFTISYIYIYLPIKHHGITTPKVNKPLNGLKQTGLRCVLQGTAETFHDKSLGDI